VVALICSSVLPMICTPSNAFAAHAIKRCNYDQLEVAVAWGPGAAAGHIGIPFLIVNKGKDICSLKGYPTLQIATEMKSRKPIKVVDGGGMIYAAVKPKFVVLKPGADASFGFNYVDALNQEDAAGPSCTVQSVYVTLPDRYPDFPMNFETTVNFNACHSGYEVSVTSIQMGPSPKEG
jgi:hypothetical protein